MPRHLGHDAITLIMLAALVSCGDDSGKPRRPVNDPCQFNDDCSDAICHYGVCFGKQPGDGAAPCAGPGDCKSFVCASGKCKERGERAPGETCLHDAECSRGPCVLGKCGEVLDARADLPPADAGVDRSRPDGNEPDGNKPDGNEPDGNEPDGNKPDGNEPDGNRPDGHKPDGNKPEGGAGPDAGPTCVHPAVVKQCTGGWCTIPAGCFEMGSPLGAPCSYGNEPQHRVTLTRGFELQSTEVTQAQFDALMGYNPSWFSPTGGGNACGATCPVERVTWHEAAAYCNALSAKATLGACYACSGSGAAVTCDTQASYAGSALYNCPGYRLPTEAEWEYAYRAGTTTAYYGGSNSTCTPCNTEANLTGIAWYCGNSGQTTHPVAQKTANAWGLYDMAGNVYEWVHSWSGAYPGAVTDPTGPATGTERACRGGSWVSYPAYARAADRYRKAPTYRGDWLGFRCAKSL